MIGFGCIVVDPPWKFKDEGSRITPGYPKMTNEQILDMDVGALALPDAHIYLWTTDTHLPAALDIMDGWGFDFKMTGVWVKTTNDGQGLRIGAGHYLRHAHELFLFGTRGRCPALVHDVPSVIFAPRGIHSAKPEALQDAAERVSPGPYCELFARRKREGWYTWGNEVAA